MEEFRLGVQKCKKTIQNAIGSPGVFKVKGARIIFRMYRRLTDLRSANTFLNEVRKKASATAAEKEDPLAKFGSRGMAISMTGLTGIVARKRKDQDEAKSVIAKRWGKPIDLFSRGINDNDGLTSSEKRAMIVSERCKAKSKKFLSSDRLLVDKDYLVSLSRGIGHRPDVADDEVEKNVAVTAYEALDFLRSREKFWKQIQLGESGAKHAELSKKKARK